MPQRFIFHALTLLAGLQEWNPECKKYCHNNVPSSLLVTSLPWINSGKWGSVCHHATGNVKLKRQYGHHKVMMIWASDFIYSNRPPLPHAACR